MSDEEITTTTTSQEENVVVKNEEEKVVKESEKEDTKTEDKEEEETTTEEKDGEDKTSDKDDEEDKDTSVKLFVGQVPKTMMEDDIRPMFAEFGEVLDVSIIRDKTNGNHRGCAFVTFSDAKPANDAIEAFHDKKTLPKMHNPMQVKPAYVFGGNRTGSSRRTPSEIKLFVGMVPHSASEDDVRDIFIKYGEVEEVYILRDKSGDSRGCAFVRYANRDEALSAIEALHHKLTMDGSPSSLVVKFADSKREKYRRGNSGRYRRGNRSDSGKNNYRGRGNRSSGSGDRGRSRSSSNNNGSFSHQSAMYGQNWTGQGQQQYGMPYGMPPPQGYPQFPGNSGFYGYGAYVIVREREHCPFESLEYKIVTRFHFQISCNNRILQNTKLSSLRGSNTGMVICTLLRDTTIQCLLVDTSHLHSHLVQCPLRVLVESPPPSLPCNTFPKSTRTAIFNDFSLPLVKLKRHVSQALRTTADCRQAWSYTKIQSQHVLH